MTRLERCSASRLPVQIMVMAILLFGVAGCNTVRVLRTTPPPQVIATRLTAEVWGKLVLVDGCLRVETEYDTSKLLVWPPGFVVEREGDSVKVADTIAGEEAEWRIGDMVWFGGGEISSLDEQTQQSVPSHCAGPYWLVGGLEMPGTARNLPLFLESKGVKVEATDEATDHGFSISGKRILADGEAVSLYEFLNQETAEAEAGLVSPDGFTITREQGDAVVVSHLDRVGTPHFYQKGRLIAVYVDGHAKVRDLLTTFFGPQFAGGD